METCHYCGFSYHPMPVYILAPGTEQLEGEHKPHRIHVCHIGLDDGGNIIETTTCREKAAADGYRYRRDLTPVR